MGPIAHRRTALLLTVALALVGCSSGSPAEHRSAGAAVTSTEAPPATDAPAWADLDRSLAAVGPNASLLVAEVVDGRCRPVHAVAAGTTRPVASQFKLFVLGAVADEVAAGTLAWSQRIPVPERLRSLGNVEGTGSLQFLPPDATVTVQQAAEKLIAISDNTAADVLVDLVGRRRVEAQARRWSSHGPRNTPFLTTREVLLLHYGTGLADRYLATPRAERRRFLEREVDPLPVGRIADGFTTEPSHIEDIEWPFSASDLCRAWAGLAALQDPVLDRVLSRQTAGIDLPHRTWSSTLYKGGSEPGVLTMGWLARTADGDTYVVEALVSDPVHALPDRSLRDLVQVGRRAFSVVAGSR